VLFVPGRSGREEVLGAGVSAALGVVSMVDMVLLARSRRPL
jgi:hypothetical protein